MLMPLAAAAGRGAARCPLVYCAVCHVWRRTASLTCMLHPCRGGRPCCVYIQKLATRFLRPEVFFKKDEVTFFREKCRPSLAVHPLLPGGTHTPGLLARSSVKATDTRD